MILNVLNKSNILRGNDDMRTMKKEVKLDQVILMKDGSTDYVEDYDGDFYFLEKSGETVLPFTMVDVVVKDKE